MSDLESSLETNISVIRNGTSVGNLKEAFGNSGDISLDTSLSLQNTQVDLSTQKTIQKRKATEELATQGGDCNKRPCMEAEMGSKVDLEGKGGSFRFLHPVVITWSQGNESKSVSLNALIDTGADISLFDVKFIEEQMVP